MKNKTIKKIWFRLLSKTSQVKKIKSVAQTINMLHTQKRAYSSYNEKYRDLEKATKLIPQINNLVDELTLYCDIADVELKSFKNYEKI